MFERDSLVMYQTEGVCRVTDITNLDWVAKEKKNDLYYILAPVKNPAARIYCPVDNRTAVMRPVMTQSEAEACMTSLETVTPLEVVNEKQREDVYKAAIRSGNPMLLVQMIRTLYGRRKSRLAIGKKMTSTDERYYKAALNLLLNEVSFVLDREEKELEKDLAGALEAIV